MRRSSESPESGARKRRRLSSPTYEEHFPITQEDMATFDELQKQLSQAAPVVPSQSRSLPSESHENHPVTTWDVGFLEGHNEEQGHSAGSILKEWSSSPPDNYSTTQERATEDAFFTTDMRKGGSGLTSAAASLSTEPQQDPSTSSAFTSATSFAMPRTNALLAMSGFTSAAKLGSTSRTMQHCDPADDAPPSTLSKYGGFGLASALPKGPHDIWTGDHPTSPLESPEQDYDSWFNADATQLPADAFTFKTARTVAEESQCQPCDLASGGETVPSGSPSGHAPFKPPTQLPRKTVPVPAAPLVDEAASSASPIHVGFSSAASIHVGKSNWAAPSAAALALAAQKMKQWEAEFAAEDAPSSSSTHESARPDVENAPAAGPAAPPLPSSQPFKTPLRPALQPMENNGFSPVQPPDTPLASKNPTRYTDIGKGQLMKNTQFKSPVINRARVLSGSAIHTVSPLNPMHPSESKIASTPKLPATSGFGSASSLPQSVPVTPMRPGPSKIPTTTSPGKGKSLGMTPRRGVGPQSVGKGRFSTPFKAGMAPGQPGRTQLDLQAGAQAQTPARVVEAQPSSARAKPRKDYKYFDLNPRPDRKTLASSGLHPQSYTDDEMLDMGIDIDELRQMTPANAVYYTFYSMDLNADGEDLPDTLRLGPEDALARLQERGCKLATQQWVINHYGLILWKLAAMVCLEPEREQNPRTKRWCWPEVMRQLLYRYERELNGGSRPALRLISTEDAPAACPMVLCVSKIVWSPAVIDDHGVPVDPHPELEITDGWYLLRAKVDLPLARAVRRGTIRVGTKLAVSGARLSGDRKEACEILDAYDSTCLELCGNSTHLAPWHAKLGFVKDPFIATLDSLTADGGTVPAMDLIVQKAYPIAYLEFVRNEDGSVSKLGPRNEKEELKAQDQWLIQRENAIASIRADLEKQIEGLEKMAERLCGIAGPRFDGKHKPDDPLPDHIENLYSEIVEEHPRPSPSQLLDRLNYMDAGWLCLYTEDQIRLAKERIGDDIERELQHACPPRSVRDFRVVVVKDARWTRKEPMRTAQITLWDPMRMVFSEGGSPGEIREGQRFLVTNLVPSQLNAWMAPGPESVVYLVSKKDARWTNIKSSKC
ncbi:hypothetical protein L226DRAFT_607431 [Lentinus tigrinus ALCF2SS1-7]|uniref:uncharacterized protein n=1 Tax=Lentinus tigrinus ALCF2SS1-7 TaxID=1328758 RepID=UPI0011663890|nr:hypothetical protein L226DRAFT_607431 [Lentinus tigrinus ALCF2SS1-7]